MTPHLCKAARAYLDWSQADLGDRAGVTAKLVQRYENGDTSVRQGNIDRMAAAFKAAGLVILAEDKYQGLMRFTPRG